MADTYDVAFGNATPPPLVSLAQSGLTYAPGSLSAGTNYYWQIIAHNDFGSHTGPIWQFKTGDGTSLPPPTGYYNDGLRLRKVSDDSQVFLLGTTAFPALQIYLDSGTSAVDPLFTWMTASGLLIARVWGMYESGSSAFRFHPGDYGGAAGIAAGAANLADYMATKGLVMKLSLFNNMGVSPLDAIDQVSFFNTVATALSGKANVWLDVGNEYQQNGFDPQIQTQPASLLSSRGSGQGETSPPDNPWNFFDYHSSRRSTWPRDTKSIRDIQVGLDTPIRPRPGVIDEPIGIDETADASTTNVPDDCFDFVANPFASAIILHVRSWQGGALHGFAAPGPIGQACVDASVAAAALIPPEFRDGSVAYTRGGLSDFPLVDSPYAGAGGPPIWWDRAYGRIIGGDAWVTIIRPDYGAGLVVEATNGWTIAAQYGARNNVIHLTR